MKLFSLALVIRMNEESSGITEQVELNDSIESSISDSSSNYDEYLSGISSNQSEISSNINEIRDDVSGIADHYESSSEIDYTLTLNGISSTLSDMSASFSSSASSSLESDSSDSFLELQATQTFLISLIVGLLICYIFVCNFIKH